MKTLIHNLITDIKYLFPCIAYDDLISDQEVTIKTETKLSRLYPITMRVEGMTSVGEDFWGRHTFKNDKGQYYCELEGALYFKGNDSEGEPHYPVKNPIIYETSHIDKELSEFKPCIDKVQEYALKQSQLLELVDSKSFLEENKDNFLDSKIIGVFKFKIKSHQGA